MAEFWNPTRCVERPLDEGYRSRGPRFARLVRMAIGSRGIICTMRRRLSHQREASDPRSVEREQMIQILSLEYQFVTSGIQQLSSGRYQFFGLMTAAAALLGGGVDRTATTGQRWILGLLSTAIFMVGLVYFLRLGRHIVRLSARAASIEARINELAYSQAKLLSWESEHQGRKLWNRVSLGSPLYKPKI